MPGYSGAIYVIIDTVAPDSPREIGRFHMQGQHLAAGERSNREWFDLHGPAICDGNLSYLPYAGAGLAIVDIGDLASPRLVGHLDVHPPLGSGIAAHTVIPYPERKIAIFNSEALAERCQEPANFAAVVDIADPTRPWIVSFFPTPVPPKGYPVHSFCAKGGRFGPHNQHLSMGNPNLFNSSHISFMTYFNAGLRVFDTADPHQVDEIAFLIPSDPGQRHGVLPTELVVQVEDVLVDARGFVYFTEKNSGLYVAHWEGPW